MATFNLGGVNQYGEPFGLHLMDPLAAGSGAWASKDGIDAGGPITSPVLRSPMSSATAGVSFLSSSPAPGHWRSGKYRGGMSAEVALTLGGAGVQRHLS
jgi:N-methylhydantoinase B